VNLDSHAEAVVYAGRGLDTDGSDEDRRRRLSYADVHATLHLAEQVAAAAAAVAAALVGRGEAVPLPAVDVSIDQAATDDEAAALIQLTTAALRERLHNTSDRHVRIVDVLRMLGDTVPR
jgi:hypothetical protein